MATNLDVFISSKMQELKAERASLYTLIPKLLTGLVELNPWIYESTAPASIDSTRTIYLRGLRNSALYIGVFWNEYGEWTIDEFEKAKEWGIDRLIFVKDVEPEHRGPHLKKFLADNSNIISSPASKYFVDIDGLCRGIKQSVEFWLASRLQKSLKSVNVFNT